jgi:hypothetical protein
MRRRHSDITDRELRLSVEHRLERGAVVRGLPHAAIPEADVERVAMLRPRGVRHGDVTGARAHAEGAQIAIREGFQQCFIERIRRLRMRYTGR